jgi:hypothetical protein
MNALTVRRATQIRICRAAGLGLAAALFLARAVPAAEDAGDWRVTLLKPKDCQACVYLEESLKRRGTLQQVPLADGPANGVTASIERRPGGEVTAEEWQELLKLPYFDQGVWKQEASQHSSQVLLKHDGHIVAAGNIADSWDQRDARFPDDLTLPLGTAEVLKVRSGYMSFYRELFIKGWNLDWFYRLARDPSLSAKRRFADWVERQPKPATPALGAASVLLASTGNGASDNPIFNAIRSEEIEQALTKDLGIDAGLIQVRYGAGPERGFNAVEATPQGLRFVRREVQRAEPFTIQSLAAFFDAARARPAAHRLLVLIGHGGPDGAPLWGQVSPLGPDEMKTLHARAHGTDVLVSGNCFGGVLAQAVDCGFFGARPDTVATGCQSNAAEVAQSQDYLHVYFEAFAPGRRAVADADGNGVVSFEEAHWYATRFGDPRNLTYSTGDALAEAWFTARPAELPAELSVAEFLRLAEGAGRAEHEAAKDLAKGLPDAFRIPLTDLAAQATRYSESPTGPRPMLGQMARRLLYTQKAGRNDPAFAAARSCGAQSPAAFLKP